MNIDTTMSNNDIKLIKKWILNHLHEECNIDQISHEIPLIEQLDSFQLIGFLIACDEKFKSVSQHGTDFFGKLNIDGIARCIAQNSKSTSNGPS